MSSFDLIEQRMLKRLAREEFAELKKDKEKYALSDRKIEEFFLSEQGYRVLQWAISINSDDSALRFLCEEVPAQSLEPALKTRKFAILKTFLRTELDCEETEENDQFYQKEKLRMLFKISPHLLQEFIQTHNNKPWMTANILRNCSLLY